MSWVRFNNATNAERFNRNKVLINENKMVKVYKTHGIIKEQEVILYDGRESKNKSKAILKDEWGHKRCLDVSEHFKSFKEVFKYIELNYKNNFLWEKLHYD